MSGAASTDTGILTSGNIVFGTNAGAGNTERMRITSTGNVGIGTTNPQSPLQLGSVFALQQDVNSGYIGANFGGIIISYIKSQYANQIQFDSALGNINFKVAPSGTAGNPITYTTAMAINSSGEVGIGTTNQNNPLEVDSSAGAETGINIFNSNINGGAQLSLHSISTGTGPFGGATISYSNVAGPYANALVIMNTYSAPLILGTNNANRFEIDNNGDVGVAILSAGTSNSLCYNNIVNPGYNSIGTCSSDERVETKYYSRSPTTPDSR